MSTISYQANIQHDRLKSLLRLPLVLISLCLILFYMFYLVELVPIGETIFSWRATDNATVVAYVSDDSAAAFYLKEGDIVLSIDGNAEAWSVWEPMYNPRKSSHTYEILRGEEIYIFTIPESKPNFEQILERLTTSVVSLLIWSIASLVILFATPQNKDAWQLGLTTLGFSVTLTASEAALYNVPGAWLLSYPFFPILSVALIYIALLPRQERLEDRPRLLFFVLSIIATLLGVLGLVEIIFFYSMDINLAILIGVSFYELVYICLGLSGITHLIILGYRYLHTKSIFVRQQVLIILTFTGVALLPGLLLTLLPRLIIEKPLLPWHFSIALLAMIPGGYGYVIYRRNYLGLDIFVTNSLTYLLVSLVVIAAYSLVNFCFEEFFGFNNLGSLPEFVLLFPFLIIFPYTSKKVQFGIERIIYGREPFLHIGYLRKITSALAIEPQIKTLCNVLDEIITQLQIRQGALFLRTHNYNLDVVHKIRVADSLSSITLNESELFPGHVVTRFQQNARNLYPIFQKYIWIDVLIPLVVGKNIVGLFCLGSPVPDGYLNKRQIDFLRQVADVMAVAVEAMRLFDSSREMSRELMRIRDAERMQVANQIHDEPLQRMSIIANQLSVLSLKAKKLTQNLDQELFAVTKNIQEVNKQLRDICAGLHPPMLKQGVQWAVEEVVHNFKETTGVDVGLAVKIDKSLHIPPESSVPIYYVLVEALNNVRKHTNATYVNVKLLHKNNAIILFVIDNGNYSETVSRTLSSLVRAGHFGLVGMHEWANLAGGHMQLDQHEHGGTKVTLTLPLSRQYLRV